MLKISKNSYFTMLPQKAISSLGNRILQVNDYGLFRGGEVDYWCEVENEKENGTKEYSQADIKRVCDEHDVIVKRGNLINETDGSRGPLSFTFLNEDTLFKFLAWLETEGEE